MDSLCAASSKPSKPFSPSKHPFHNILLTFVYVHDVFVASFNAVIILGMCQTSPLHSSQSGRNVNLRIRRVPLFSRRTGQLSRTLSGEGAFLLFFNHLIWLEIITQKCLYFFLTVFFFAGSSPHVESYSDNVGPLSNSCQTSERNVKVADLVIKCSLCLRSID